MKWILDGSELDALFELCSGVCLEGGSAAERLASKGLTVREDGFWRPTLAGEMAMGFLEGQTLDRSLLTEISLVEESVAEPRKKSKPRQALIDDFF